MSEGFFEVMLVLVGRFLFEVLEVDYEGLFGFSFLFFRWVWLVGGVSRE